MRQRSERHQDAAERTVKDIRRKTRKRYSSEEKIRIVLAGLSGLEFHRLFPPVLSGKSKAESYHK